MAKAVTVEKVRGFWQKHPPQVWYSQKKENTKEYFEDIALNRYNIHYRYLPDVAEFSQWQGKNVLEIGCGIGTDGLQFAKNGAVYTGVDLTERAIGTAKIQFNKFNVSGTFMQANAEKLPFKDNTFDLVYSFGVLHHTPHPQKAFNEVYRVLKPGGKAIIMLYARGWKHWFVRCFWYGLLHLEFVRFGIQETFNRRSDGKSLTYMFSRPKIRKFFRKFKWESLTMHRLGAFFDWGTTFPRWFVRCCYALRLEKMVGENWILKVRKP